MGVPVLIALALIGPVVERVAVERLLGELGGLRAEFQTLRITATLAREDAVYHTTKHFDMTLLLLNEKGTLFGAMRVEERESRNEVETWVLRDNDLFCYDARARTIRKCNREKAGTLKYVADYWHAALWLLDPAEARKRCEIRHLKRDDEYNYFAVNTEQQSVTGLFFGRPGKPQQREYRLAVTRVASDDFPAGTVRKVSVALPSGDTEVYTLTSWARDKHKITPKNFPDPSQPPDGWVVMP